MLILEYTKRMFPVLKSLNLKQNSKNGVTDSNSPRSARSVEDGLTLTVEQSAKLYQDIRTSRDSSNESKK